MQRYRLGAQMKRGVTFLAAWVVVLLTSCTRYEEIGLRADIGFCYWKIPKNFTLKSRETSAHEFVRTERIMTEDGSIWEEPSGIIRFKFIEKSRRVIERDNIIITPISQDKDYIFSEVRVTLPQMNPFVGYQFEVEEFVVGMNYLEKSEAKSLVEYCLRNKKK